MCQWKLAHSFDQQCSHDSQPNYDYYCFLVMLPQMSPDYDKQLPQLSLCQQQHSVYLRWLSSHCSCCEDSATLILNCDHCVCILCQQHIGEYSSPSFADKVLVNCGLRHHMLHVNMDLNASGSFQLMTLIVSFEDWKALKLLHQANELVYLSMQCKT